MVVNENESPMPQLDGAAVDQSVRYSFQSDYGEEDIEDTLSEIFPENVTKIVSRVRVSRLSATHDCVVELQQDSHQDVCWPAMNKSDSDVFQNIKRL